MHKTVRLLAFLALGAPAENFTIPDILSVPFNSDLTAAPAANRIAWVMNARGIRNVWMAEAPSFKARQLTSYTQDDGQEIGELEWTHDAMGVLFTRGGDLGMLRESPNPTSLLERPVQAVWRVSAAGGAPVKVGDGHSPAASSKGSIAYIKGSEVWRDGKKWFSARGGLSQLSWAPDGSRIALVVNRGDHAFVAVTSGDHLTYLSPSVDSDTSPVWSPDGTKIAYIRNAAVTRSFTFGPVRHAAEPWSIYIADSSSGRAMRIWQADRGPGSAFQPVVASQQLFWTASGRLVFPWEKTGWRLLYSVPVEGGSAAKLHTPGAFEVEHVSISPDRTAIYYSSNQDDIDRRHIWRMTETADKPEPLSVGPGIEWAPVALADNKTVALLHADTRVAAHPSILREKSVVDIALDTIPANFPKDLPAPQQVVFPSADGMSIHGQLWVPPNPQQRRLPAVVFFHGGSRRQMLLGRHYNYYYNGTYAFNQYLASQGYVVLSVNYRSGIGYGLNFREAENYGATGASEFNDVMGAGLYLRSLADVDPKRIGVWGGSYGGYLTALALARASDLFACGVDVHGVHDWNNVIRNFVPSYNPESQREAARLAFESSPLASISTWRSPVLLIHGDDDRNVPFGESVRLAEALRKQNVPFDQLIFPDDVHDFLTHSRWIEAYRTAADFLGKHLKK